MTSAGYRIRPGALLSMKRALAVVTDEPLMSLPVEAIAKDVVRVAELALDVYPPSGGNRVPPPPEYFALNLCVNLNRHVPLSFHLCPPFPELGGHY